MIPGLTNRLLAFERLLEDHPEYVGEILLMQIAVPSRSDVIEYQDLKERIDKLVGMINGKFSTSNWSPIRYIYGQVNQVENFMSIVFRSKIILDNIVMFPSGGKEPILFTFLLLDRVSRILSRC